MAKMHESSFGGRVPPGLAREDDSPDPID